MIHHVLGQDVSIGQNGSLWWVPSCSNNRTIEVLLALRHWLLLIGTVLNWHMRIRVIARRS